MRAVGYGDDDGGWTGGERASVLQWAGKTAFRMANLRAESLTFCDRANEKLHSEK